MASVLPDYAELHALSNFSFQRGASQPEELVERAHALGYTALALSDECSVAGVVRAHQAAKACGLQLLPGAEFRLHEQPLRLVVLPHNMQGWGDLCEFITAARQAGQGTEAGYRVALGEAAFERLRECELLLCPLIDQPIDEAVLTSLLHWACALWAGRLWLAAHLQQRLGDALRLQQIEQLSERTGVPLLAAGGVLMHLRSRKPLHDVMTAIGQGCTVREAGRALQPNAQAHLRSRLRLAELYPPDLLAATLTVARRCRFSLDEIRAHYAYPRQDSVPAGHTPLQWLHQLTEAGLRERYPQGAPAAVTQQIAHELTLIAELRYEMYFLTVYDIVRFARSQGILCQGRGSAANSAVCYCLGITAVDPAESRLLFERFISRERLEAPDIDVDFEHQRREEVIAYIYRQYGHERAAIAATVIRYRPRSALRDVGKALGLQPELIEALSRDCSWLGRDLEPPAWPDGVDPQDPAVQQWLALTLQALDMPRHLGQHVGGFVLTHDKLTRLVPVQPAAMAERYIIQWDKDDLEAVGLMKVDVLALGMLSAIRGCLDLRHQWRGTELQMHQIPADDSATYDMICAADTVGVFQIESRAQMGMLPRLQPRCYYDLVVQVAIVRPGPIQGGMVHPYLEQRRLRRALNPPGKGPGWEHEGAPHAVTPSPSGGGLGWGQAAVTGDALTPALSQRERGKDKGTEQGKGAVKDMEYPELAPALGRTLGVPIFQEQVMQIAMIAADFTPGEADQLRRAMAAWKRKGGLDPFRQRLVGRMIDKGYEPEFAQRIFSQIEGFGEYGFPESHAASFAKLVYVSCWLKRHEPACFLAAMLNAQPLGFYSPSQLVQDARRHGIEVRAVDVMSSSWDCILEEPSAAGDALTPAPSQGERGQSVNADERRDALSPALSQREGEPRPRVAASESTPSPFGGGLGRGQAQPAVRLGLRLVSGLSQAGVERILAARAQQPFASVEDLALRAELGRRDLDALAAADALSSLAGHRRQQVWAASALQPSPALLRSVPVHEPALELVPMAEAQDIVGDYQALGLSLRRHPLALLRPALARRGLLSAGQLEVLPDGRRVAACGIVTVRQQPSTAKGTTFVTLEDESGSVNVIAVRPLRERQRDELLHARLLAVWGVWQRSEDEGLAPGHGRVRNLVAHRLQDLSELLGQLAVSSRDFR
jgi:error-prone DNA polymerase